MDSAEFEAIDVAVNQFYGQIDGYQNTLCDRLCECEDEGEIDRLFSLISNMDRVDSLARALELKVMFDGGVAPMVLRLAETSSRCMANADASGENVPWAELANLFGQTMAVACARQGAGPVNLDAFEEANAAVERRLAEARYAEERAMAARPRVGFGATELLAAKERLRAAEATGGSDVE